MQRIRTLKHFANYAGWAASALAAFALAVPSVHAQSFPSRPVRVLLGFPPGGSTDIGARLISTSMAKRIGQPMVIENRPGADGLIAARAVETADPDGYTLLFGGSSSINPIFIKENAIDTTKDMAPVGISFTSPFYLFVRSDLPIKNVADLVAYAKKNPGKLNFGSPAVTNTLVMNVFEARTGIETLKVPYKGAGPVTTAMLAGEVDVATSLLISVLPVVQSGKMRPIVSTVRSALMPEVPTAVEAGLRDFGLTSNLGFFAPKATPAAVINKLSSDHAATVKSPEVAEQLRKNDVTPIGSTPEEAVRLLNGEFSFYAEGMKLGNYKPQ